MPLKDIIVNFEPINFLKDKMRRFKKKILHLMVEVDQVWWEWSYLFYQKT